MLYNVHYSKAIGDSIYLSQTILVQYYREKKTLFPISSKQNCPLKITEYLISHMSFSNSVESNNNPNTCSTVLFDTDFLSNRLCGNNYFMILLRLKHVSIKPLV